MNTHHTPTHEHVLRATCPHAQVLFDGVLPAFEAAGHAGPLLEAVERAVLGDWLRHLDPGVMQALVLHLQASAAVGDGNGDASAGVGEGGGGSGGGRSGAGQGQWVQRVERAVLHLDIMSLDLDQVGAARHGMARDGRRASCPAPRRRW